MSGICRGKLNRNVPLLRKHFPTADLFFSTWEGKPKPPFEKSYFHPEPEMHYHPYIDAIEECEAPKFKAYKAQGKTGKGQMAYNRTIHHSKQILAHAHLLKEVPEEYDMIIRARYDTVLSDKVDFTSWLKKSYEEHKAVGIGTRTTRHPDLHTIKEVPQIYPHKNMSGDISQDWGWYLMDPLIFHRRDMFNVDEVFKMHEEKKLWPAEYGWYQVLSMPYGDNHISLYGGAQIERYLK